MLEVKLDNMCLIGCAVFIIGAVCHQEFSNGNNFSTKSDFNGKRPAKQKKKKIHLINRSTDQLKIMLHLLPVKNNE